MELFFLPQVFPEPWNNNRIMDFPGKLFLSDLASKIVNGIRIRQIRVQPRSFFFFFSFLLSFCINNSYNKNMLRIK